MMFDKTYFSKTGNTFLLLHIVELLTHINGSAGCGSKIVVTSFLEFKGWTPTWQLLHMFYISSIYMQKTVAACVANIPMDLS